MMQILETLQEEFAHWKETKTSLREPVPEHILNLIRKALESFPKGKVSKLTGVCRSTIERAIALSGSPEEREIKKR